MASVSVSSNKNSVLILFWLASLMGVRTVTHVISNDVLGSAGQKPETYVYSPREARDYRE